MRLTLPVIAASAGVIAIAAIGILWVLRPSSDDIVPTPFRGVWLDKGAECKDASAQARITATTINYDQLSFKADGIAARQKDAVTLTGKSFPNGRQERTTVELKMQDRGTTLFVVTPGLRSQGPFVRCSDDDE